ncbi:MAG: PDZ domain-containing protein [Verrucomicrobia bacterium]|nr:PDZ domain-containing protein [Verrucomicrobiota bacterium]
MSATTATRHKSQWLSLALIFLAGIAPAVAATAQTREEKVRNDQAKVGAEGFWIYNDVPRAFAEAKKTGKPMLVLFRCIPCVECVKLDDDLVNQDAVVRPLLGRFVCVRVIATNGLDLSLFQFDTDQSSAVFLLNADGTIYGRYGTRSHHTAWEDDLSVEGLARAMEGALALHAQFPQVRASLAAKRGPPPEFPVPEKFPSLEGKYTGQLDYAGNVVKSCIHCHQIGDAQRRWHLDRGAIPENVLFPYPHPKIVGLALDPKQRATVLRVEPGSAAEKAGFAKGDVITHLNGQPLLSIADAQWVLHHTPAAGGSVRANLLRAGRPLAATLTLAAGWRRRDDIEWRVSSWPLRQLGFGGMKLEAMPPDEAKAAGLTTPALRVKHVGQFAPHDLAKKAGIQKDDIIVSLNGKSFSRETDALVAALGARKPGGRLSVELLRGGNRKTVQVPFGM